MAASKHCETCNKWFATKDLADVHFRQFPFHEPSRPHSRWALGITVNKPLYEHLLVEFAEESPIGTHLRDILKDRRNRIEFAAHKDDLVPLAKAAYDHRDAWPGAMDLFNAISQTIL